MVQEPVPPIGVVGGHGGEDVCVSGRELAEMVEDLGYHGKGGVEVDGMVLVPGHGEEVGEGVGRVVETGTEMWELGVQGGSHSIYRGKG